MKTWERILLIACCCALAVLAQYLLHGGLAGP